MTIYIHFIFAVLLSQGLLLGCSQRNEHSAALPNEVKETSGIACLNNERFLTINDSGNPLTQNSQTKTGKQLQPIKLLSLSPIRVITAVGVTVARSINTKLTICQRRKRPQLSIINLLNFQIPRCGLIDTTLTLKQ